MKNLEKFKDKKIDLKTLSSFNGGESSCCETEFDTTWKMDAPGGVDHTVTYYDDNGNETGWKFTTNIHIDCPIF